jgi:hypothetical protein
MPSDHTTTQLAVLDMAGTTITDDGVVQRSIDTTLRLCGLLWSLLHRYHRLARGAGAAPG